MNTIKLHCPGSMSIQVELINRTRRFPGLPAQCDGACWRAGPTPVSHTGASPIIVHVCFGSLRHAL